MKLLEEQINKIQSDSKKGMKLLEIVELVIFGIYFSVKMRFCEMMNSQFVFFFCPNEILYNDEPLHPDKLFWRH